MKNQVFCSNCGFLGWLTVFEDGSTRADKSVECRPKAREDFQTGKFSGEQQYSDREELDKIYCYRMQWLFVPRAVDLNRNWVDANVIRRPRQCPYYMKYEPGFGPEEHKELKREAETRRTIIISSLFSGLIGAMIGAGVAIIAQLVSR